MGEHQVPGARVVADCHQALLVNHGVVDKYAAVGMGSRVGVQFNQGVYVVGLGLADQPLCGGGGGVQSWAFWFFFHVASAGFTFMYESLAHRDSTFYYATVGACLLVKNSQAPCSFRKYASALTIFASKLASTTKGKSVGNGYPIL